MENVLIVLAVVGSLIYKVYTNYKEEMEKAAKRKQPTPSVVSTVEVPPPVPNVREEYVEPIKKKNIIKAQQKKREAEAYIPIEVKRVQETKLRRLEVASVKPVNHDDETTESKIAFDLRQAVIQSAILERPYHY